jgi:uncharacterized damage-inducible protein DinB
MTWTAPEVTRVDEPFTGDERATLDGFLDWYRATLLYKCQGLDGEQLARRAVPPSNLSLLGLIRHMAKVERSWFRRQLDGEDVPRIYASEPSSDADFDEAAANGAEPDYATFTSELEPCRAAAARHGLDETFVPAGRDIELSLRWLYVHMIEEYSRHCGHADLLRQRIDGTTGS